ncbi:thymidine phosphorylase [Patescibacteria group bacterium]
MIKLKPIRIPMRVGNKYIVVVNESTAEKLDVRAADRVDVNIGRRDLTCILDISEQKDIKDNQVGLFAETWDKLKVKSTDRLTIFPAPKPEADAYIKKKLEGHKLEKHEIDTIIRDVVNDDLSDIELTYFVSGCFCNGLSDEETANLTRSIVKYGDQIKIKNRIVMDKHCIGGVPGNRTTMLVVPMITALGYYMPKTSSRAITSPSGTADTMEVIANVVNDAKKLHKILKKTNGFITWGGGVDLAAADDKLIKVRYPLKLDPQGMLLASIMAKKHSVSSNNVIIDIPWGPQGKAKTKKDANALKKRFLSIAKLLGMKMKVVLTSAAEPIGYGIGPLFEVQDVLKVLKNEPDAPQDLKKKAIMLVTELLYLTGKHGLKSSARRTAKNVLKSGKAYDQFMKIVKAQGAKKLPKIGEFKYHVKAGKNGKVTAIKNKLIATIARQAGAPLDSGAGVYIHKKIGDKVKKGDKLFTIYAENENRVKYCKKLPLTKAYTIN